MPRKLRIHFPGAMHHVMNRGDQREAIFRDDTDWQKFHLPRKGCLCVNSDTRLVVGLIVALGSGAAWVVRGLASIGGVCKSRSGGGIIDHDRGA
jgi:hypothetical protein